VSCATPNLSFSYDCSVKGAWSLTVVEHREKYKRRETQGGGRRLILS